MFHLELPPSRSSLVKMAQDNQTIVEYGDQQVDGNHLAITIGSGFLCIFNIIFHVFTTYMLIQSYIVGRKSAQLVFLVTLSIVEMITCLFMVVEDGRKMFMMSDGHAGDMDAYIHLCVCTGFCFCVCILSFITGDRLAGTNLIFYTYASKEKAQVIFSN